MGKVSKSYFETEEKTEGIRINKYLSDAGVCSRREADRFIENGDVKIDGVTAVIGSKVEPGQIIMLSGIEIEKENRLVLIAFNKPEGIVCTTDQREPNNIIDFLKYGKRIYPIGRLDKDSEGLLLLTNDGNIVNKILRAGNQHEKEYIVTINKPITEEFLKKMAGGIPILDTVTRPCTIEAIDRTSFRIILTQGLNRQIRRMCEYCGFRVLRLQRVRIMNVNLGRLKVGGYRNLTEGELEELALLIKNSKNTSSAKEIDDEWLDIRRKEDFESSDMVKKVNKKIGAKKPEAVVRNRSNGEKSRANRNFSTEKSNTAKDKRSFTKKKDNARKTNAYTKDFHKGRDLNKNERVESAGKSKNSMRNTSSKKTEGTQSNMSGRTFHRSPGNSKGRHK